MTEAGSGEPGGAERVVAPAKLTVSLQVEGVEADGYHRIRAEMVTVDLADELHVDPSSSGLVVEAATGSRASGLAADDDNLVSRALRAAGRSAGIRLVKRIPVQGGLGGGSADAAAVLRWAGVDDPAVARSLGSDVPFCLAGGRATVSGTGEQVEPLPYEPRSFVLVVPPFGVDTAATYLAWDVLAGRRRPPDHEPPNDLARAAIAVEPRLMRWRDLLVAVTGRQPVLAGSGSTWFVEGTPDELGLAGRRSLELAGSSARVIAVETVPAGWRGPGGG